VHTRYTDARHSAPPHCQVCGRSELDGTGKRREERGGKRERVEGDVEEKRPDFIQSPTAAISARRSRTHRHGRIA
jgi:hypothetical protein